MAIDTSGVKLEDRPLAHVREEVIDQLIMNYSHGVISEQAFERRLDIATNSDDYRVLVEQVADLTLLPDEKYRAMWAQSFNATSTQPKPSERIAAEDAMDRDRILSILSSDERTGPWRVPQHLTIVNALSSVELDFSEALFKHQQVTLQLSNWLGSIAIKVPEHVAVLSDVNNIAASTDNSVGSGEPRSGKTHCIRIQGYSVLGSLDIAIKRSLKERFTDFANTVRSALGLDKA